ncbi:MAG TPA: hypothetical protein VGP48_00465 [Stellaceae bacterium]|nr:hypothetical protein [Stellaceae bacterium]
MRLGLMALAATVALSPLAHATGTAPRSFVESTGNDSNTATNCSSSAPCRSFSAAYGITAPGGEIIAIDTAGFGVLTITGPISIIGTPQGAEVTVSSGTGITVSAGATDKVILRNIVVNGGGVGGTTGISVTAGRVVLENSVVKLLGTGLAINNAKVDVRNTDIIGNTIGIQTTGTGTDYGQGFVTGGFGPTQARLYGGSVVDNTTAFFMINPGFAPSVSNNTVSNVTILIYNQGSQQDTEIVGNGTVINGSGTGCPSGTNTSGASECNTDEFFSATNNDGVTQP